jgi:hypothetical protein
MLMFGQRRTIADRFRVHNSSNQILLAVTETLEARLLFLLRPDAELGSATDEECGAATQSCRAGTDQAHM